MEKQINLVRAIGCEFVSRKFKVITLIICIPTLAVLLLALWLTAISPWWWLLAVPVIVLSLLELLAYTLIRKILKMLVSKLTKQQASNVSTFVDKLERVADNIQTPLFIVIFRMAKDIIRPRKPSYIQTVSQDSTTLYKDFTELQRNFKT